MSHKFDEKKRTPINIIHRIMFAGLFWPHLSKLFFKKRRYFQIFKL